ncbi:MAG TPA: ribosome-associated translation inhibitor RaiA [Actinomycetota bacterium]|nr:ribosome-associated translation inhibitor RaiA [Actinomycetota bacterium]
MDLHLNGRGVRITERLRQVAEQKLRRLERMEPKLTRLEVELISEKNPRQGGVRRVEIVADTPRKVYRARANAPEVETAIDLVAEKIERQMRDHHEKRRTRLLTGAGRVKSSQVRPQRGDEE